MTSNRPDAAPGSDQMFVMGMYTVLWADDSRRRRQVWGDKDTTSTHIVRCPNSSRGRRVAHLLAD